MTRGSCVLIFLLVAAFARRANADEPFRLEVVSDVGAQACAREDVVRARVAERLGRDPFTSPTGATSEQRSLRVAFARASREWTAEIALLDRNGARSGARSLTHGGSTCEPLVTSVVFTIAVLLEELSPRPEPAKPVERPIATPVPPPEDNPQPPPPPVPVRSVNLDVSASGVGAIGAAPSLSVGGELGFGVDVSRFRGELSGRLFAPASSDGDVAVRTSLVHARIAPCYGWPALSACAVGSIGSLSGEAVGARIATSRIDGRVYAAVGAGLLSRLFFANERLFVRGSIDVLASLSRTDFDVGTERVWSLPPVGASATLGLGARLP